MRLSKVSFTYVGLFFALLCPFFGVLIPNDTMLGFSIFMEQLGPAVQDENCLISVNTDNLTL